MNEIIEYFKSLNLEKFLELLKRWYVILFLICLLILIAFLIFFLNKNTKKQHNKMLQKHLGIIRLFSIHYEEDLVYAIDKFNFRKKRKEDLNWFYNSFTPKDKLRLVVWINELQKEDHKVPHHLELNVKIKSVKQPIFCVISVTSINYDKKVIHMESRLFPNIKNINKNKRNYARNSITQLKELPELLKTHITSPKNVFLVRLYSTNELDDDNRRVNHLITTLILSRLVRFCNDNRNILSLNSNEILLLDFKMTTKNEAYALAHSLSNEISKVLFLSSIYDDYAYKIGIVQVKETSSNLQEEIKLAREMSISASKTGDEAVIYDENIKGNDDNQEAIIKDIRNRMDHRTFSCRYTPILNTYDGSIFGYQCDLYAPKALVASISDMQDYAMQKGFLSELNRILYIETNNVFNFNNSNNRFVYTTMELKPNQYLSFIDFYTHIESLRHVRTIFIIEDDDLSEDQQKALSIVKELKKYGLCLGLKITSTSLDLLPEILKSFDFFFLYEESFKNVNEAQNQIFYLDMLERLATYSAQIISTNISTWGLIDFACKSKIKHVSSPLFSQEEKKLPIVDIKKSSKLVNICKHY